MQFPVMTVTSLSYIYIYLHQSLCFYFNHYGKDFASCQNLCPKHLLMYLIINNEICSNQTLSMHNNEFEYGNKKSLKVCMTSVTFSGPSCTENWADYFSIRTF